MVLSARRPKRHILQLPDVNEQKRCSAKTDALTEIYG